MRNVLIQLLVITLAGVCPASDPATGKIIAFAGVAWGTPPPQVIRQNLEAWEALPFDGLVFGLDTHATLHARGLDTSRAWPTNALQEGVAIMRALPFRRLTHNYARLNTAGIRDDWFDDRGWAEIVKRAGWFARAAKASGAAGILLDTEHYVKTQRQFWYLHQAHTSDYSYAEYNAKTRQRGAEVMRAIRGEFPGVNLYLTYTPSINRFAKRPDELARAQYGLLVGFFDGILQEARGCTVTDGFEKAYKYQADAEFARAVDVIRDGAASNSVNPQVYRERVKVGFGLWPVGADNGLLDTTNFAANAHTPPALESALRSALRHSDGVVWVYGGGIDWTNAPREYLEAIGNARVPTLGDAASQPVESADGKIIAFAGVAWGTPPPQVFRDNLAAWDTLPFDGVVFDPALSSKLHHRGLSTTHAWPTNDLDAGVALMRTLAPRRLRFNFARLNTCNIDVDWFDDVGWAELARRAGLFARAARESGAAGIMLDTEHYTARKQFAYAGQALARERGFAQYNAKVRQRGAELMRAIRVQFPGVNLCLTYGPSVVWETARIPDFSVSGYGLLVGFFDGLLDEARGCRVIDGYEQAYNFRTDAEFARGARTIRREASTLSAAPRQYRRHVKVGFGVWPVMYPSGRELVLNTTNFAMNCHTPIEFEHALSCALRHGDGPVWVYGGGIDWTNAPPEYLAAIRNARAPHSKTAPGRPGREADQIVFEEFYRRYEERLDLAKGWRWRADPGDAGVTEKWFAPGYRRRQWRPMRIREFWDTQLERIYEGYAWYRVEFEVSEAWLKEPLILAFGAVDEQAWVYVNGKPAFDHARGSPNDLWNSPFGFDVRPFVQPGKNELVVRVHNGVGPGGIWRGVKLFGPAPQ